jgi:hypothetical protein
MEVIHLITDGSAYIKHIKGMIDVIISDTKTLKKNGDPVINYDKVALGYCMGYIKACENFKIVSSDTSEILLKYCDCKIKEI